MVRVYSFRTQGNLFKSKNAQVQLSLINCHIIHYRLNDTINHDSFILANSVQTLLEITS